MSKTLRKGLSAVVLVALVIGYLIDAGNEVGGVNQAETGDHAQRPTTYTRRSDGDQLILADSKGKELARSNIVTVHVFRPGG